MSAHKISYVPKSKQKIAVQLLAGWFYTPRGGIYTIEEFIRSNKPTLCAEKLCSFRQQYLIIAIGQLDYAQYNCIYYHHGFVNSDISIIFSSCCIPRNFSIPNANCIII